MAVVGINGIGWFAVGVVVALGCYTASSRVAAQRERIGAIDRSIDQARSDIRMLKAEFATRANILQIEQWNGDVMRLAAPQVGQIVSHDTALASIDGGAATAHQADYVVPSAVGDGGARAAADTPDPAADAAKAPRAMAALDRAPGKAAPTEKVAMVDRKLLRDTSLNDLLRGARGADIQ